MTTRALPCPRCAFGLVSVAVATWPDARARGGERRSAWADEPLRCSAGCALTTGHVVALLGRAYRARVWQEALPLTGGDG